MRLIPIEKARVGMILGKNIYGTSGQVLLNEGVKLTEKYLSLLANYGVSSLYIKNSPDDDIVIDDIVSEKTRLLALNTTRKIVDKIKVGSGIDAKEVKLIIDNIINDILKNPNLVINLVDIRSADDYLFGHSVNAAVLSTLVGVAFGYNQTKLYNLAVGALFHDIGKIKINPEILHKTGPLTPEEKADLKKHPDFGFDILRSNPDISLLSAHVAYQHHEWFDGNGYPRGLKGEEIHHFARIVSVTQTYDLLTSDTPQRARYSTSEAVEYLMACSGSMFDPEVVRTFLSSVAIYPVGTQVQLNTGDSGIVVKVYKNYPTRPVIRIIRNPFGIKIDHSYEVDLLDKKTLFITRVIED